MHRRDAEIESGGFCIERRSLVDHDVNAAAVEPFCEECSGGRPPLSDSGDEGAPLA